MTSGSDVGASGAAASAALQKQLLDRLLRQLEQLRLSASPRVLIPDDVADGNPDLHRHNYFEIRSFLSGTDGVLHELEVVRPGVLHYSLPIALFSSSLVATLRPGAFGCSFCGENVARSRDDEPLAALLLRQLDYHARTAAEFPFLAAELSRLTIAVLSQLIAVSGDFVASPAEQEFIYEAATSLILRNHACADFSVADIADKLGVSGNYLLRLFNRRMKCSVRSFLITTRLNRACELLETGEHSVGEVARLSGWKSHTYFSQAFHRQFGITPAEFAAGVRSGGIRPRPYPHD